MKKKILIIGLTLLSFIMVVFSTTIQGAQNINELYVFGDSLSDVGNVFRATGGNYPSSPPYFQGRYSNGPVWVEYLASQLALTPQQNTNFAYGGATMGSSDLQVVPNLLAQVDSFTKTHHQVNPKALYVLWAGANDYLYGATNNTLPIGNLSRAIQSLSKAGAQKIMVPNLPDLGNLPATRNTVNTTTFTSITTAHNLNLSKELDVLKQKLNSDTQLIQLDVNSLYHESIQNPAKFGFTNVTSACLSNINTCDNPSKFLFWDGIHPTTFAHQILAKVAVQTLNIRESHSSV
ncbi:SGNH/GDSL hydrolase family protein [Anabaena lutea FACHB-196]|uniref:SGNH/GDSL hydrolase family protein n=2 Tax=Anabaena TaxID=1163 RepID=A0ABR8FNL3_9NOST|nr:SGNH/GDSL hydrolase family protein [Anabaena lutea FACHB-196]